MKLKERARALKIQIPALYLALKNPGTPLAAKILAGLTVGYALSPIDLIPDFIPVLGYLDDLILLPLMVAWTIRLIPKDIMENCRIQAENLWKEGKPKRWAFAVPILAIWLILAGIILKIILD